MVQAFTFVVVPAFVQFASPAIMYLFEDKNLLDGWVGILFSLSTKLNIITLKNI